MSSQSLNNPVDLAPTETPRPGLALALALISVPGVTIAWDLSAVAGFAGTAIGIAAIVIGLKARTRLAGAKGRGWPQPPWQSPLSPCSRSSSSSSSDLPTDGHERFTPPGAIDERSSAPARAPRGGGGLRNRRRRCRQRRPPRSGAR